MKRKTIKPAVERCTVKHLHWHRFRCWEIMVATPLFLLWMALLFVLPKSGVGLGEALAVEMTLYVVVLLLMRRGHHRMS